MSRLLGRARGIRSLHGSASRRAGARGALLTGAVALLASGSVAAFQTGAQRGDPSSPPQDAPPAPQVPWPILLGYRALDVEQKIPVIDRVVLVQDEATYLDEISRWSTHAQWPVLIEDDRVAPRFIRAFKPAVVLRRLDRAAALPDDAAARRRAIEAAVTRAWDGDPATHAPLDAFKAVGLDPAGLVITSTSDPAWTAAVALAAGRGQMIGFIEGSWGHPSDIMDAATFTRLSRAVNELFRASGLAYESLGDSLDACTLCLTMAAKCVPTLDPAAQFRVPGAPPVDPRDPLAVTDCLGRHPDGRRYAFCGAIWGDAPRAAAMAMSSLFLPRESFTFINSYGESGDFAPFGVAAIQERHASRGYRITPMIGANATLRAWQRLGSSGLSTDVLFVNSSGDSVFFDMGVPGRTPPENRGSSLDIPPLNTPLALQFVHSFSLQAPGTPVTIGARWLDQGVYAYVGSVHEPFLAAFVPPRDVMERVTAGVPFIVAARHWEGPFAVPWRVMTIGDPLMTAVDPAAFKRRRLPPDSPEPGRHAADDGRELRSVHDLAADAMRACRSDPTPENFLRAFRELDRLADDSIVRGLWSIALAKGAGAESAAAALGALYRARDVEGFLEAFRIIPAPGAESLDMLWSLMTPRLNTLDSADDADLLARSARPLRPDVDLIRLAPAMARLRGSAAARAMLIREAQRTQVQEARQALQAAAAAY